MIEFSKELENEGILDKAYKNEKREYLLYPVVTFPVELNNNELNVKIEKTYIVSQNVENEENEKYLIYYKLEEGKYKKEKGRKVKNQSIGYKKIDDLDSFKDILLNIEAYTQKFGDDLKGGKSIGSNKGMNSYNFFIFKSPKKFWKNESKFKDKMSKTYNENNIDRYFKFNNNRFTIEENLFNNVKCFLEKLSENKNIFIEIWKKLEDFKNNIDFPQKQEYFYIFKLPEKFWSIYKESYENYLVNKIFAQENKKYIKDGKCTTCETEKKEISIPNTFHTLNEKKPFLKHYHKKTEFNNFLCRECSLSLYKFQRFFLKDFNIKVFPLFIKGDLKNKEIKLLKRINENGEKIGFAGFRKVMRNVYEKTNDQYDFYLILYNRGDFLSIDYISGYKLFLKKTIQTKGFINENNFYKITDVFDFEEEINSIFSYKLRNNYFGDIKKIETQLKDLVYSYREDIFNFIYRNNRNLLNNSKLEKIFIKLVEINLYNKGFKFRSLTDRFIVLNEVLRLNIKVNGGLDMEKLNNFREELRKFVIKFRNGRNSNKKEKIMKEVEKELIKNNQEYISYVIGQVVYYILSKSKTEKKTHQLLESFINVGNLNILSRRIIEIFEKYKHEINFNDSLFKYLMGVVLSYCEENSEKQFKNIKTIFYIGYFDRNLMFLKSKEE